MKKNIIQEDIEVLRKHRIAKRVYALLFKEELSVKELAEKIYNNKKNRHEITKWITLFKLWGWIEEVKSLRMLREKKYRSNLKPFMNQFDEEEHKFVEVFLKRFWTPQRVDPLYSLNEILLEAVLVKNLYKLKGRLVSYHPESDLKLYSDNKSAFWGDEDFRRDFLDKIKEKGEKSFKNKIRSGKKTEPVLTNRAFMFMCLLIPESILEKLNGDHLNIGNPLFLVLDIIKN